MASGDTVGRVRVDVRNTGARQGRATVQVYVGHLPTRADTPARQLAGFRALEVKPGGEGRVTVGIDRSAVSYFDEARDTWVTPKGRTPVYVGTSADDARFAGWVDIC